MCLLQPLHSALSAAQGFAAAVMLPTAAVQACLSCTAALQAAIAKCAKTKCHHDTTFLIKHRHRQCFY